MARSASSSAPLLSSKTLMRLLVLTAIFLAIQNFVISSKLPIVATPAASGDDRPALALAAVPLIAKRPVNSGRTNTEGGGGLIVDIPNDGIKPLNDGSGGFIYRNVTFANPHIYSMVQSDGTEIINPISTGLILPDGTLTFTPEEFQAGRPENYINYPNTPIDPQWENTIQNYLMGKPVPEPAETLMHKAPTPPRSNAILGLASYPEFMEGWLKLVGSLRTNGYDGHIIVGVNPAIPQRERNYLDKMGVTYYAIETANCSASILENGAAVNARHTVRAKCSKGMEDLKLEWGRYEMARRWLSACTSCTGWSMVIDTRDIFFQADPFLSLGDPKEATHDLLFVEEIAQYINTMPETPHRALNIGASNRYRAKVEPCYGKSNVRSMLLRDRPMLCSGTVLGTREGIHRFLSVLVDEFQTNNNKGRPECRSPGTTDQWTMNHLYYKGRFGFRNKTKTLPWGSGPVLTVGKPCVDNAKGEADGHSQKDMIVFDKTSGLILNPHEKEGSLVRVAPTLHQWDRCGDWIRPWFREHKDLYARASTPRDEPGVKWV